MQAIEEDGGTIETRPNGATGIVADVQRVCAKFLAQRVSDAETADERLEDREKAFRHAVHLAPQP
jgi:hypothetical protein